MGWPAVFMARFQGGYKSCVAHIDSGSNYNFYYMRNGCKQVTLIPPEYSQDVTISYGNDSVFVEVSEKDHENFGHQYTAHWFFKLVTGDVLIFNNCAMMHQFTNLTGHEDIYTIRSMSFTTACSETLRNDRSVQNAYHMARESFPRRSIREITQMST